MFGIGPFGKWKIPPEEYRIKTKGTLEPKEDRKDYRIRVHLNDMIRIVHVSDKDLSVGFDDPKLQVDIDWYPTTEMNDWEAISDLYKDGKDGFVARGQGVGVITVNAPFQAYIKIIRDSEKKDGIHIVFSIWNESDDECKRLFYMDNKIGYDILKIDSSSWEHVEGKYKSTHPLAGKVWLPGLSKDLEEYVPNKKRKTEDS